jgi:dTDP-glucose 4,6-dehydratase
MNPYPQEDLDYILDHTQDLWPEFKNENIFITGGTGFIGCNLLKTLTYVNEKLNLNMGICVLTRNPDKFCRKFPHMSQKVNLIEGDLTDSSSILPLGGGMKYFIHGATDSIRDECYNNIYLYKTIVEGTKKILDHAYYYKCKNLLYIGSGAVYGKQYNSPLLEEHQTNIDLMSKNSTYAESKRMAEHLCFLHSSWFNVKIARPFNLVGPYLPLNKHYAIGEFIKKCIDGEDIAVINPAVTRSYLYTADMVVQLLHILVKGASCKPYNVGSGLITNTTSMGSLAETVRKICNPKIHITLNDQSKFDDYIPNTNNVVLDFELFDQINLEDAIKRTWKWNLPLDNN